MAFRFFRPWEDDWTPNTSQTPAPHHGASAERSATTKPPHMGPADDSRSSPGKTRTPEKAMEEDAAMSNMKEKTTSPMTDVNGQTSKSPLKETPSSAESLSAQELAVPQAAVLSPTHTDAVNNQDARQNGSIGSVTSSNESLFPFGISIAGGTSSSPGDICILHDNDNKLFKYEVCDKAFLKRRNLQRHEKIHTGSISLKCALRANVFTQISDLNRHQQTHKGSRPFKCTACEKTFTKSSDFRRHERIYTGSKPFQCRFCKKVFTQSSSLRVHERTYTGSKPFQCWFCKKAFTTSSNLRVHERSHTGSKPFMCQFCNKAFTTSSNLRVHERTHTASKPFKCRFCEKVFTQSSHLRRHERIHARIKPFKCTYCDKAFSDSSNMRWHERIHASSKSS